MSVRPLERQLSVAVLCLLITSILPVNWASIAQYALPASASAESISHVSVEGDSQPFMNCAGCNPGDHWNGEDGDPAVRVADNLTAGEVVRATSITGEIEWGSGEFQCASPGVHPELPKLALIFQAKDAAGNVVALSGPAGTISAQDLMNGFVVPAGVDSLWGSVPDSDYGDNDGECDITISRDMGGRNDAACAAITMPATVRPGEAFSAQVAMNNNGENTWKPSIANSYFLFVFPEDAGAFGVPGNIYLQNDVTPGNTANFNLGMTAPQTAGTYKVKVQMEQYQKAKFGDACNATVTVQAQPECSDNIDNDGDGKIDFPNDLGCTDATDTSEGGENQKATCKVESFPNELTPGEQASFVVSMKNNGNVELLAADLTANPAYVEADTTLNNGLYPLAGLNGTQQMANGTRVAPGATYTFTIPVTATDASGEYTASFTPKIYLGETLGATCSKTFKIKQMNNDAKCISMNGPSTVDAGEEVQYDITFKNTGDRTWFPGGAINTEEGSVPEAYPTFVDTNFNEPQGSGSPFDNGSFNNDNLYLQNPVAPGQTVTVRTQGMKATAEAGTYTARAVVSRYQKIAQIGEECSKQLTIKPAVVTGNCSITGLPSKLVAGQQYTAVVRTRNTGTFAWKAAPVTNPQYLAAHMSQNASGQYPLAGLSGTNTMPDNTVVNGGGEYTFSLPVTATDAPGDYTITFQEKTYTGAGSENDPAVSDSCSVNVKIEQPKQAGKCFITGLPSTVAAGETYTLSVRAENDGEADWKAASSTVFNPQYLAAKMNQVSGLYGFAGLSGTNTMPDGTIVSKNGGTYTFNLPVTITNAPGTHTATFQMKTYTGVGSENDPAVSDDCSITYKIGEPQEAGSCTISGIPSVLVPGQSYNPVIQVVNTGDMDWRAASSTVFNPQYLAAHMSQNASGQYPFANLNGTNTMPNGTVVSKNGGTFTFNLPTITATDAPGTYTTTFQMKTYTGVGSENDPAVSKKCSVNSTINPKSVDLSLVKTATATAIRGNTIVYTLAVTNLSTSAADNVVLKDTFPTADLTFQGATGAQCSVSGNEVTCNLGSVQGNETRTVQIAFGINQVQSCNQTTNVQNTATVTATDADPVSSNNSSSFTVAVSCPAQNADLSISKSASPAAVTVGENTTFTVTVSNQGPSAAAGVVVNDLLPAGLTFVTASASQGNYSSSNGTWNVGNVTVGGFATLQIVARVTNPGTVTNTATVTATTTDPNQSNNTASAQVFATAQGANLAITKTASNLNPVVGQNFTYTLTVTNLGPSTATTVAVADLLPSQVTFVSANATQGNYSASQGQWNVGTLTMNQTATLQIVVTANTAGSVTNNAAVTSAVADPDQSNNNASVTVNVGGATADLTIIKTASTTTPAADTNFTYSITVTNPSSVAAQNVTVTDQLPVATTFVSSTATQGSYSNATSQWTIGTLAANSSATLTITVKVTANSCFSTPFTNTATVSSPTDPNGANNTSSVVVTAQCPQSPDLSITKTASTVNPIAGQNFTYTLTVNNPSTVAATNVVVTDQLPSAVTFVAATATNGSYNSTTGQWTIGTLAANSTATLQITVKAPGATNCTTQTFTNTASVTSSNDPNGSNNSSSVAVTTVCPTNNADLAITKTVSNAAPTVGQNVTYTVTVTNMGPALATGVSVTDQLPAGVTFVNATTTAGTYNALTGQWTIGSLNNAATATLQITVVAAQPGLVRNTATVSATTTDPNASNNTATVDMNVTGQTQNADLSISKTVAPAVINAGESATFTVTVTNLGPGVATGVIATDQLPSGLVFQTYASTHGTFNQTSGQWNIGTLNANETATLSIGVTSNTSGTYVNTATVASTSTDPNTANNSASTQLVVQNGQVISADLSISKTVSPANPVVGSNVTYRITVTNLSQTTESNSVTVSDPLPAGTTFVSATVSRGTFSQTQQRWNMGSLPAGATATLDLVVRVDQAGTITNTATVSASTTDPNNSNNSASATFTAGSTQQGADISIAKTVSNSAPAVGATITYTVTATNLSSTAANSVTVNDLLPSGVTFVSATATQGTYASSTGVWTVGTLNANATATLQITATVNAAAGQSVTNTATTSTTNDPNPSNNSASATFTVTGGGSTQLTAVKSDGRSIANVGDTLSYTITVTNPSSTAVTGVSISDFVPTTLNNVTVSGAGCTVSGNQITCSNVTVPANGSVTITVSGTVLSSAQNTTVRNTANITVSGGNSVTASDDTFINPTSNPCTTNCYPPVNPCTTNCYPVPPVYPPYNPPVYNNPGYKPTPYPFYPQTGAEQSFYGAGNGDEFLSAPVAAAATAGMAGFGIVFSTTLTTLAGVGSGILSRFAKGFLIG